MSAILEAGVAFVPAYPTITVELLGETLTGAPDAPVLTAAHVAAITVHGTTRHVAADSAEALRAGLIAEARRAARGLRRPVRLHDITPAGPVLLTVHPEGYVHPIDADGALPEVIDEATVPRARCLKCRHVGFAGANFCAQCRIADPHLLPTITLPSTMTTPAARTSGIEVFTSTTTDAADAWCAPHDAHTAALMPAVVAPEVPVRRVQATGVTLPQGHRRLPHAPIQQDAAVWVLGVHGGAGESTLTAVLPDAAGCEHAWPDPAPGQQVPVLLCARSNHRGLTAVQHAVMEWAAGTLPGVDLVGVVVIADAPGRTPKPIRERIRHVTGGAPRTFELGWIDPWRYDPPDPDQLPAPAGALVSTIRSALEQHRKEHTA